MGRLALVGVGNVLKADDGAGPLVIQRLQGKTGALLFDVGTTPENHAGPLVKAAPDTVIIIDAVHGDDPPGTMRLLREKEFASLTLSTHAMSIKFFIDFLKEHEITNIALLGIQPETTRFGDPLSAAVAEAVDTLEKYFSGV